MAAKRGVAAFALGLALWLVAAPAAFGQEKSFTFPEVNIEGTVLPDGSMDLVEHRTFLFSGGDFSVGTFGIDWPHALVESFAVQQSGQDLNVTDVSDGPYFQAEWNFPTFETGRQTFDISYRVRCAVRVYTNLAHLYWQFVGSSDAGTDHVHVVVHLPGVATGQHTRAANACPPPPKESPQSVPSRPLTRDEVGAKAYGPANGTFDLPNPQTVVFDVRDVPADGFVEGSVYFPPGAVPLAHQVDKTVSQEDLIREAIPGIGWFDFQSHRRSLTLWLLIGLPIFWLAIVIATRIKDRLGIPDDVTQPPEPADPVDIAVLWGAVRGQTFSMTAYATEILHLARAGVIDMQPEGTVTNPTDFRLKLVREPETDVDKDFVRFLFGKNAKPGEPARPDLPESKGGVESEDGRVSLNSLRRKGSSSLLRKWSNDAKARSKARLGVPKNQKRLGRRVIAWTALLGAIGGSILCIWSGLGPLLQAFIWEAILVGGIMALAVPPKLDPELDARMAPWRGFRNYLKNFSSLPDAPALAIVIWEQYLEYATALGVADRVAKQVKSLVPAEVMPAPWPGAPSGTTSLVWLTALRRVSAIPPAAAVHSGSSSSSGISSFSSSGGSFSSGGGFGGGGTHVGAR
jgi:uncharacterized membrane protein YgcG